MESRIVRTVKTIAQGTISYLDFVTLASEVDAFAQNHSNVEISFDIESESYEDYVGVMRITGERTETAYEAKERELIAEFQAVELKLIKLRSHYVSVLRTVKYGSDVEELEKEYNSKLAELQKFQSSN